MLHYASYITTALHVLHRNKHSTTNQNYVSKELTSSDFWFVDWIKTAP